jgi:hypothetical protein
MSSDGVFTVTSPTYPGGNALNEFDEIKENFEFLRRFFMEMGAIPINGATMSYSYNAGKMTTITFGGTLAGSASFSYTGNDLTGEVWTLYGKTITVTHTYSLGILTQSTFAVA